MRGITVKGLAGTKAYLYLESIEISKKAARGARRDGDQAGKRRIKRVVKRLNKGDNLFDRVRTGWISIRASSISADQRQRGQR